MTRRGGRWFVALVGLLLALALAPAAESGASGGPKAVTEHFVIEETAFDEITSAFCGFPVEQYLKWRLVSVSVFPNEQRGHNLLGGPTRYSWTNLDTGRSIEFLNTVTFHDSFTVSGSSFKSVFRVQGLNYRVRTPLGNFTSAGSSAIGVAGTFDEQGMLTSIDVFGHVFTPNFFHAYPVLCVFLGAVDSDHDYLPDTQGIRTEEAFGTDPHDPDTDGDGYLDGVEVANETDPGNAQSHPQGAIGDVDKDDDYLDDGTEVFIRTDPTNPDTDGDGYLDGLEWHIYGTDPGDAGSHP